MKIGIIGTGMVGRAFALRLGELGHSVILGTRDVGATKAHKEPDSNGICGYALWAEGANFALQTFNECAKNSAFLINASRGIHSIEAFQSIEAQNLHDKVILDLSLPLAFAPNRPPHLAFSNDDSLGERLQRLCASSFVVKTFNTMSHTIMLNPSLLEGAHNVFLSGDSTEAKEVVKSLLREFGWSEKSMIDLGGIISARGSEMYANLLFHLAAILGTYDFNIAVNVKK